MKKIIFVIILFSKFTIGLSQKENIRLAEYLCPHFDSMTFNCVYNGFHGNELQHDTIVLILKKLNIENETAYCISNVEDTTILYSELDSFLGSAMIFRNDSILLAPLQWEKSAYEISLNDFKYFIPPNLRKKDIVTIKLHDRSIKLSDFNNQTLTIGGHTLKNCLKIKISEQYKAAKKPFYGYVWLNKTYGIIKWIRVTQRTEVRDLSR